MQMQWYDLVTLNVTVPEGVVPDASGELQIEGYLYTEATFIS